MREKFCVKTQSVVRCAPRICENSQFSFPRRRAMLKPSNLTQGETVMTMSARTVEYGYYYFSFTAFGKAFRGLAEFAWA